MIFFTSDTHFGHSNIIKYENRPFNNVQEMDRVLIERWNEKIKQNDEIYILGDFSFHKEDDKTLSIIRQLNGRKYLIIGNHDKNILRNKELKNEFEWVKDYYCLKANDNKYILFHYPIQVWDCKHHNSRHLYGHIHSQSINHHGGIEMPNSLNVGVGCNNLYPISIYEVEKIIAEGK